jgi:hypothetical protein
MAAVASSSVITVQPQFTRAPQIDNITVPQQITNAQFRGLEVCVCPRLEKHLDEKQLLYPQLETICCATWSLAPASFASAFAIVPFQSMQTVTAGQIFGALGAVLGIQLLGGLAVGAACFCPIYQANRAIIGKFLACQDQLNAPHEGAPVAMQMTHLQPEGPINLEDLPITVASEPQAAPNEFGLTPITEEPEPSPERTRKIDQPATTSV